MRAALALLDAAGYELKGTTLRARGSGRPFRFEIMVTSRDDERLALAFAGNLARADQRCLRRAAALLDMTIDVLDDDDRVVDDKPDREHHRQ